MASHEPLVNNGTPPDRQRNLLKDYFDEKELKFRHLSADQFADVWLRYDRDGWSCYATVIAFLDSSFLSRNIAQMSCQI